MALAWQGDTLMCQLAVDDEDDGDDDDDEGDNHNEVGVFYLGMAHGAYDWRA